MDPCSLKKAKRENLLDISEIVKKFVNNQASRVEKLVSSLRRELQMSLFVELKLFFKNLLKIKH